MSNSNEVDDFMDEYQTKQTKLEKFIKTIDRETMDEIEEYLDENQPPPTNEGNSKTEKIKLWHDLSIIYKFKQQEKEINSKKNKKIIEELCLALKGDLNLSAATIRERIQKKLANVSKEDILNHIKQRLDFTFDTKRKLIRASARQHRNLGQWRDQLSFEDNSNQQPSNQGIKAQVRCPNRSSSSSSVEQIPPPSKPQTKSFTRKKIRQQKEQSKGSQEFHRNFHKYTRENINTFFQLSDHESDEDYMMMQQKENHKFKPTSKKVEQMNHQVLQKIRQIYVKNKQKKQENPNNAQNQFGFEDNQKPNLKQDKSNHQNESKENIANLDNQKLSDIQPSEQQLKLFSSLEDWKLANQKPQEYEHLKWYPEEDQYLSNIVNNPEAQAAVNQLKILIKFKTAPNILSRIKYKDLNRPHHIMMTLLNQQ